MLALELMLGLISYICKWLGTHLRIRFEFKATDVVFSHLPNYHVFGTHVHEWPLRGGRVMDNMEAVVAPPPPRKTPTYYFPLGF